MTTSKRLQRGTMWGLLGLLAIGVVLPMAGATAVSNSWQSPNPNAPAQSWAWGAVFEKTSSGSVQGSSLNGTPYNLQYSIHAFLGWNTILTQTNTSTTSFTLSEQRVLVASYYLSASGSYGQTTGQLNVSAQGWEIDAGSANFTTTGSVLINGTTSVQALAVENAQGQHAGNFTATATASLGGNTQASWNGYVSADAHAQASIGFQPPLGLIPLNATPGATWTSTSSYTAQGNYTVGCHFGWAGSSGLGAISGGGNCGSTGSASGSGTVTLLGADLGVDQVNGHSYRWITLGFRGDFGFELRDGILLVPTASDVMGGGALSTNSGAPSDAAATSTSHLDLDTTSSHIGIVASNTEYAPNPGFTLSGGNPGAAGSPAALASAVPATSAASSGVGSYNVQGEPESASSAQSSNGCLLSGACGATHSGLGSVVVILVIAAVAVAAIVGAVILERGRRSKGPVGGYSTRPPSAFLLHNDPRTGAPYAGSPPSTPSTSGYAPGRPPA